MCSRFELTATAEEIARHFGLAQPPALPNAAELRPTDLALVLTQDGPRLIGWGLAVDWDTKPLINARAETLTTRKTFSPLLENRCLIPATAYFEWRKEGAVKLKNRIGLGDDALFSFAGLTDGERFTIVTCEPTSAIAHIHDRMPVILEADAETRWIDPGLPFGAVEESLAPYSETPMQAKEENPPPVTQPDLFD
ncbi:MAG: SOS response-associated peptidase [Rhodospirillales bacterium]|nr:SOS response-associated peptidase [Alphaproteobacteria bacterium]MBL6947407.1 SOS response-associated peptidase [Rhodospirillales bacterium]